MLGHPNKMLFLAVRSALVDQCFDVKLLANLGFYIDLDSVKIEQTYKHPCLFTVTVDGFRSQGGSGASSPQQDMSQWHLPVPDPRGDGKYMYRLHTVDMYFWTQDDATMFIDSLRRVMQPHQLQIVGNPQSPVHAEHKNDMLNPVIANLEKAAISHTSRSPSISTTQSFPGPPTAPAPTSSPPVDPSHYAPMAYNPAAPAAPEPIAHREKTPPPPDAADGTGLGAAAIHDQLPPQYGHNPLQSSFAPQPTTQPYMPGPPSRTHTQSFTGPPTPGIQRMNTGASIPPPPPPQSPPAFAPPPSAPPLGQYDQQGPPQPNLQRHSTLPPGQQFANYAGSPGFPPAGSPLPSPGYAPQHYQPLASPPPGGFAQFQYGSTGPQAQTQQVYRPTEQEASVQGNEPAPGQRKSNMGKRAEKVEKGVGRFLKKLDKKF